MIFVTVGTHEQPFDRLVQYMDNMRREGDFDEEVVIQTGYSTYEPNCCIWQNFYTYQQMVNFVERARVVITHGGPSSFVMPLQVGKIPIVVPRQKRFHEHVNDHQVDFCDRVSRRINIILLAMNVEEVGKMIRDYDEIVACMRKGYVSNNSRFCDQLEEIVDGIFEK